MASIRHALCLALAFCPALHAQSTGAEYLVSSLPPGHRGGRLVVSQAAEPKSFNPVVAIDRPSREIFRCINADLIHINRFTQKTEPALARSWTTSPDGRRFTLNLRRGVRFSDGQPFDADDVIFSFKLYLDEKVASPQGDLLIVGGKPVTVEKLDSYTVRFTFASPYAAAERVFDSVAILPRHLLQQSYDKGQIGQAWTVSTPPAEIAGLGPFRIRQFLPGDRVVLERNPYYWKRDSQGVTLPYFDELIFLAVPTPDAQVIRFRAGDTQIISGLSADNFLLLGKDEKPGRFILQDAGPSLEYNFLLFNLNDDTGKLPAISARQKWFRDVRFRQAVSLAIDRDSIVRLVYHGKATALASQVTPGNKLWLDPSLPAPQHSPDGARRILQNAGYRWNADGRLLDAQGTPVEFTILVSSSNAQRMQMATLIQDDLGKLGMAVTVVPMEFRSALDRILQTHDYEAAVMGLGSGDVDPTAEMNVWMSDGKTHLWHLGEKQPATPWEAGIDRLMQQQQVTRDYKARSRLYYQVQKIVAEQLPVICLASPDILVAADSSLGNFRPAILESYTLWNVDELFWKETGSH